MCKVICAGAHSQFGAKMRDYQQKRDAEPAVAHKADKLDTGRWTSDVYTVQFGQIEHLSNTQEGDNAFRYSAWGMSSALRELLADYSDSKIRNGAQHLTVQQNHFVGELLAHFALDWSRNNEPMPALETLFFTVDAELFLPHGLRMHVVCVTNIVPVNDHEALDKFVAILDPGEAAAYVAERKHWQNPQVDGLLH